MNNQEFYLDYLDYYASGDIPFCNIRTRLKFDLLIFYDSIFCLSVPSCIKLSSTAELLTELKSFWNKKRIKLSISKKYGYNPNKYFNDRKKKIESEFHSEKDLLNHFEYKAYINKRREMFFNDFLPSLKYSNSGLYVFRQNDADRLFRQRVNETINRTKYFTALTPVENIRLSKLLLTLESLANDKKHLFQRSIILNHLTDELGELTNFETTFVSDILDNSFAFSNAKAVSDNTTALSLIQNQLTGYDLYHIIKIYDKKLFYAITNLSWDNIYLLSQEKLWQEFIFLLNGLLYLYQNSPRKKNNIYPYSYIKNATSFMNFLKWLFGKVFDIIIPPIASDIIKGLASTDFVKSWQDDFVKNKAAFVYLLKELAANKRSLFRLINLLEKEQYIAVSA